MKWFSRKPVPPPIPRPPAVTQINAVNLNSLAAVLLQALSSLENSTVDLELLRARIADLCRDRQVEPSQPDQFLQNAQSLDTEAQRRLALTVRGFDEESARAVFLQSGTLSPTARVEGLFTFARKHSLLTVGLLLESPLRREEFARHFIAHVGGEVLGETATDSADRLRRLDYGTLLAEAEKAKVSAQDRVAYLRRLQEEQEKKLGRRSKF